MSSPLVLIEDLLDINYVIASPKDEASPLATRATVCHPRGRYRGSSEAQEKSFANARF